MILYAISFLSLASTIVRLVKVAQYEEFKGDSDRLRRSLNYTYWAILELMTIIICANLPAMPSLVKHSHHRIKVATSVILRTLRGNKSAENSDTSSFPQNWFDISARSLIRSLKRSRRDYIDQSSISQINLSGKSKLGTVEILELNKVAATSGIYLGTA